MKKILKKIIFMVLCCCSSLLLAELDPKSPPTDDLDFVEMQQKIDAMLPDQAGLLKFSPIFQVRFAAWPEGISGAGALFQEAFKGYSFKTDNNLVLFLDQDSRSIFEIDSSLLRQRLLASDYMQKNIQFADFCRLRDGGLAIADNGRSSLLFFKDNRFNRNVGFDGRRIFFRHIEFVEADRLGLNLVVFDSGRNHTYVFDRNGNLQWELDGRTEPMFYGNSLIRLEKNENVLKIQKISNLNKTPADIATYECQPGNIILDAWAAGTFAGRLAVVIYEGRGDEDHPDYARLLLVKDQSLKILKFKPNLDLRLSLTNPYRLLFGKKGLQLVTLRISTAGIEIMAAEIK